MAPAIQIFVSALLVSFGLIDRGEIDAPQASLGLSPTLLTAAVAVFAAIVGVSFVMSRIVSWYIHYRATSLWNR